MLHWKMSERNAPLAKEFFTCLASGVSLEADSPIYVAREKLLHEQPKALHHLDVVTRAALLCRAWTALRGGRPMPAGKLGFQA